jgi:hypothetical protein
MYARNVVIMMARKLLQQLNNFSADEQDIEIYPAHFLLAFLIGNGYNSQL